MVCCSHFTRRPYQKKEQQKGNEDDMQDYRHRRYLHWGILWIVLRLATRLFNNFLKMKKLIIIIALLIAEFSLQSFSSANSSKDTIVYICVTGKVYHSTKDCKGLSNATHKIEAVSLSEAKKTRRACKICY